MLISGWRRFYDEGDGGSVDDSGAAASVGSEGGGDLGSSGDGGSGEPSAGSGNDLGHGGAAGSDGADTGVHGGNQGAATPAQQSFLDTVRQRHGIDLGSKYKSDDEAIRGMVEAYRLNGRLGQEAALARRYAGHERDFEQYLQWRQQQAAQQQQVQQEQPWWNPPQVDPSWNRWVVRDADGNATLRDDTPIEVKRAIEERRTYLERWQNNLFENPTEALKGPLEQFKQQIRQEIFGELQQQEYIRQTQAGAQGFVQQNAQWIYERTPEGQWVTDLEGRPVLTHAGGVLTNHILKLQQAGVQDPGMLQQMAMEMTRATLIAQQNGTAGAASAASAPAGPAGQAARTPAASQPHPGVTRGRQPTGGSVPGQPRNNPGTKGKTLRDILSQAAADVPESEFVESV